MEALRCFHIKNLSNAYRLQLRHCSLTVRGSKSGVDDFNINFKACHLDTTPFQKALLSVGSAVVSLADPRRGDMIAAMGETTGHSSLEYVRDKMSESAEGQRILLNKPRITTSSINLDKLRNLPEGTVGKTYTNFLERYGYSPDERLAVRFVDDVELAYVIQRYREVHDLFHTILGMPTNMLGEVAVKWVEALQTRLPMCIGGALFGATRLAPKYTRAYSTQRRIQLVATLENEDKQFDPKNHPGKMRIPCVSVPEHIEKSIKAILENRKIGDIVQKSHDLNNYLRSRKLPLETNELEEKRKEFFKEAARDLPWNDAMNHEEKEYVNKVTTDTVNAMMRSKIYSWRQLPMDDAMCYYYLYGRSPAEFAVLMRVFNEIRLRDPDFSPRSLFDFGSGVGTVTWAGHALWEGSLKEYYTVDASPQANDLALLILQQNKPRGETFAKQVYQRQFLPATATAFDLVVSAYSLFECFNAKNRLEIIANLWSKTNGYLVIIEQGTTAGFNLIAEARDFIFHLSEKSKQQCHLFAPCPHDLPCPRLADSHSKSPCNFYVKYKPFKYLGKSSESKAETFSFLIMKKSNRETHEEEWPRIVREVLLRHKHTICRLCTSNGSLEEVIVSPGKNGKSVYKCSRFSKWGDRLPYSISAVNDPKVG